MKLFDGKTEEVSELTAFFEKFNKRGIAVEMLRRFSDTLEMALMDDRIERSPMDKLLLQTKIAALSILMAIKADNSKQLMQAKEKLLELSRVVAATKTQYRSQDVLIEIDFIERAFIPRLQACQLIQGTVETISIDKPAKPRPSYTSLANRAEGYLPFIPHTGPYNNINSDSDSEETFEFFAPPGSY